MSSAVCLSRLHALTTALRSFRPSNPLAMCASSAKSASSARLFSMGKRRPVLTVYGEGFPREPRGRGTPFRQRGIQGEFEHLRDGALGNAIPDGGNSDDAVTAAALVPLPTEERKEAVFSCTDLECKPLEFVVQARREIPRSLAVHASRRILLAAHSPPCSVEIVPVDDPGEIRVF